ncbi:MAG: glycosyltransferase family 2 protein [Dehalococcoidales bacterium]
MHLHLTAYEIIWIIIAPAVVLSWYYLIRGWKTYIPKHYLMPDNPHPRIIFLITARKITGLLNGSVQSIIASCYKCGFTNYEIKVLADKDGELEGAEHLIVPEDYVCHSKFKARALNYALEFTPNSPDVWTLHLDEDAQITAQTVPSILKYIKKNGNPVADGPTVFPYDGNLLTFFVEAQRCWTYFWVKRQLETSGVYWMNGSNMLIRTDVEHKIGWDFENVKYSEDTRFAYEVSKRCGKVFGWHGGLTLEKPPKTAGAAIKQRKRWYWGGILMLKHIRFNDLWYRLYSYTAWFLGFILTMFIPIGALNHIFPKELIPTTVGFLSLGGVSLAGVLWLARYQLGLYWQLKYTPSSWIKKIGYHAGLFVLSPVIEFICTVPTILSFINPPKVFEVTDKSGGGDASVEKENKQLTGVGS